MVNKTCILFIFMLLIIQEGFCQVTVHVLNPWRNDTCAGWRDSLRMVGNNEVGFYPGTNMTPEGGGWFYYDYKSSWSISFSLTTWCGTEPFVGQVTYRYVLSLDSLLAKFPAGTEELWISIPDTTQPPVVNNDMLGGKAMRLFNPWPDNSPQMIIGGNPPLQMRPVKGLCGWYYLNYGGSLDSLANVTFTDFFHTQNYAAAGFGAG